MTKNKRSNKYLLPMNLQYFAEGSEEGEAQGTAETETTVESDKNTEAESEKTFTQSELDEIIAKRIERERKKFEGFDELKEKATKYEQEAEERRLAELSEKERAEELAKKYEEEKAELAKQLDEYRAQVEREKVRNAFITKAQQANIAYIDDALALADLSKVTVGEEGVIGIDEVITSLVEGKPFLLGQQTKEPKTIGDASNGGIIDNVKTLEAQLEEAKKSRNFSKVIEISNQIKKSLN